MADSKLRDAVRLQRHMATLRTFRTVDTYNAFLWPEGTRQVHSVIAREDTQAWHWDLLRWEYACREIERRMREEK